MNAIYVDDTHDTKGNLIQSRVLPAVVTVICEICAQSIAKIDLRGLHRPITTDMFQSLDPLHEVPLPFMDRVEFTYMYCPYCRKRFAITEERIKTDHGYVEVPEKDKHTESPELPKSCDASGETKAAPGYRSETRDSAEVERVAHAHKAEGSNPSPATNKAQQQKAANKNKGGKGK